MIKRTSGTRDAIGDLQPLKRKCLYNDHVYEVSLEIRSTDLEPSIQSSPPLFDSPFVSMNDGDFGTDSDSYNLSAMFDDGDAVSGDEDAGSRMSSVSVTRTAGILCSEMTVSPVQQEHRASNGHIHMRQNSIRDYFSRAYGTSNRMNVSDQYDDAMHVAEPIMGSCTCRVCGKVPAESGTYHSCMHCTRSICVPHCSSVCESCGMIFCRFCTTVNYSLNYERIICPDCD